MYTDVVETSDQKPGCPGKGFRFFGSSSTMFPGRFLGIQQKAFS